MAVDTVGLGAEMEKRHGYLPNLNPALPTFLLPLIVPQALSHCVLLCQGLVLFPPSMTPHWISPLSLSFTRQAEKVSLTAAPPATLQIQGPPSSVPQGSQFSCCPLQLPL